MVSRRRGWLVALGAIGLIALFALVSTAWVYGQARAARAELLLASAELAALREDVSDPSSDLDPTHLAQRVERIEERTRSAKAHSDDPLWRLGTHLPLVGCPMGAARSLATAADDSVGDVLGEVALVARDLDPATLWDGASVDLQPLLRARGPVERAEVALQQVRADLEEVPDCGWLSGRLGVEAAQETFIDGLDQVEPDVRTAVTAATLLPAMLGGDGPRRYLLVVQNPAEARATGGLLGAYGLVSVRNGVIGVSDIRANSRLRPIDPPLPLARYGEDFAVRYAGYWPTYYWQNANVTPHFPTVARVWSDMWLARTGTQLDGVIATDVPTLSYVLQATGPVTLPGGETVTADNLVRKTMAESYVRFEDPVVRDEYFASVGTAVADLVASGAGDPVRLARGLSRAATEGRLLVWSRTAAEQKRLETTTLGGDLPNADGPFLGVVTQNGSASKLEYYLSKKIDYAYRRSESGGGEATLTVSLKNEAPVLGLPDYVTANSDLTGGRDRSRLYVSVYLGKGAGVTQASVDGKPVQVQSHREQGRPVASVFVVVPSNEVKRLELTVREPKHADRLLLWQQPGVVDDDVSVSGIEPVSAR